jgi:hypothetical protein
VPNAPATDRALVHWILAVMNSAQGHGKTAGVHAQQALTAAKASGKSNLLGLVHYAVGRTWHYGGDLERAAAAYAEAIRFLRMAGDEDFVWYLQALIADKLVLRGDLEAGEPMLNEALTHIRQTSSEWFVVMAIAQRGHVALRQGDLPGAAG